METIQAIMSTTKRVRYCTMAGFAIVTDKQTVELLIDDESSCCESWGYFLTEDDTQKFIGAQLLDVTLTDTALNTQKLKDNDCEPGDLDMGDIMFVNIHTSVGVLQFVAYNAHNGYYGHEASVTSTQLTHSETL